MDNIFIGWKTECLSHLIVRRNFFFESYTQRTQYTCSSMNNNTNFIKKSSVCVTDHYKKIHRKAIKDGEFITMLIRMLQQKIIIQNSHGKQFPQHQK